MENLKRLLFIDIETVCDKQDFAHLSEGMQREWKHKARYKWREEAAEDVEGLYYKNAALLAEFGRIVCISIGWLQDEAEPMQLHLKSFSGGDEKVVLNSFCHAVGAFADKRGEPTIVGHNIREFDIPYIGRRMIVHGMSLPNCLRLQDKKPWEIPHQDTLQMWRFGDAKAFIRLSLLCEILSVPVPKDDISGEDVTRVFWEEKDLPCIVRYCEKDVLATAKVYLRLAGIPKEIHTPESADAASH